MAEKLVFAFMSLFCFSFAGIHLCALHYYTNTPTEVFSLKFSACCWLLSGLLQATLTLFILRKNRANKNY